MYICFSRTYQIKMYQTFVKNDKEALIWDSCNRGERINSTPWKGKARRFLNAGVSLGKSSEDARGRLVNVILPSGFVIVPYQSWAPLHPPQELWGQSPLFLEYYFSRGFLSGLWKRHSWVVNLTGGWEIYISERQKNNVQFLICSFKFSKVNTLRKRRSECYCQEEACLNLKRADGSVTSERVRLQLVLFYGKKPLNRK